MSRHGIMDILQSSGLYLQVDPGQPTQSKPHAKRLPKCNSFSLQEALLFTEAVVQQDSPEFIGYGCDDGHGIDPEE